MEESVVHNGAVVSSIAIGNSFSKVVGGRASMVYSTPLVIGQTW